MRSWIAIGCLVAAAAVGAEYRSPMDVAYAPDGGRLAVSDHTGARLVLIDAARGSIVREVPLHGQPAGLAWSANGQSVFVCERGAGTVAEVGADDGKVTRRFAVSRYPVGIAAGTNRLVVANSGIGQVSVIDLAAGKESGRVADVYRPCAVALTPDGATALVGSLIPAGDARDPTTAARITLLDVGGAAKTKEIALPPGSISLRGIAVSPDGRWAYAVHSVGRFTLPTTQLERGWVMTHAMSIIDLATGECTATVLLDYLMEGGADPWDIALSRDGATAWITLAGVHQVARLDLATLHALLAGKAEQSLMARLPQPSIWHAIAKDPDRRADLVNDLAALYSSGVIQRVGVPARGPRGIAASPDGQTLAAADYFGGSVVFLNSSNLVETARCPLGDQPDATAERLGEQHFHDATACFQNWLSCASCHPESRSDGLNWDLLNDGTGNPKNTKSLVHSHRTPPVMSTGVRPDMESATEKGFVFIQFRIVEDETMDAVRAYLRSLRPEPSPYLAARDGAQMACVACHHKKMKAQPPAGHRDIGGALTARAEQGMKLFLNDTVGCAKCHPGPLFTDKQMHDVGSRHELDRRDDFDVPTCAEVWRTAPFMHDGSSATLKDLLTTQNRGDKHGKTSHLSPEEIDALVEYLQSL